MDVADAPTAFVLASTPALSDVANPPLGTRPRQSGRQIRVARVGGTPKAEHPALVQCVVARDGNVFAGKLDYVPGRKCANSRTLVSARLRRFAGDGSLAFTVVRGRSPSAIERVAEASGDCHEDTLSYDQHDQLMMKARLDS